MNHMMNQLHLVHNDTPCSLIIHFNTVIFSQNVCYIPQLFHGYENRAAQGHGDMENMGSWETASEI